MTKRRVVDLHEPLAQTEVASPHDATGEETLEFAATG